MPWLRTKDTEKWLAVSASLLRRNRDINGGFLVNEEDYVLGPSKTSPVIWNTDSIRRKFNYRGRRLRELEAAADREIKSLLNENP